MIPPILEARNVSKVFAPRAGLLRQRIQALRAVDQVSLTLAPGQTLGLVGESGSGKTTLAKLLVGLISPSEGAIAIQGESFSGLRGPKLLNARRMVQFVFQDPFHSLNPRMTVEETLTEPLEIHGLASRPERRARMEELLRAVHLPVDYAHRLPRELSGGERQRVGIARALAVEPQALICDEPIASLDVSVGAQILSLLRQLARERRMALVFISHDLRAVASLCEGLAVMRHGHLVETGSTDSLLRQPRDPYTALLIRCAELDLEAPASSAL